MRQVRTHAYAVPDVGVWIHPHELAALAGLTLLHLALFVQLLVRSNFKTGAGTTGYGELINALTPDQPERGPRLAVPSRQEVKRAMRRLELLRIVAVDKLRSDQLQRIEFLVSPRERRGVAAGKATPRRDPGSHEGKRAKPDPQTRPPLSAGILSPLPLTDAKLSTGAAPTDAVRQKLQEVTERVRGGGRTRAPKGA